MRARLSGLGPQPLAAIAAALAFTESCASIALTRLESEGYVLRDHFTPGVSEEEWCERHLLARIHRYTLKRLRREIEPVKQRDFMRYLFDWQHLSPETRLQGQDALPNVLVQLEGYEAPAGGWESNLLALRLRDYASPWLDALCGAGKLVWNRIGAPRSAARGPVRGTPIVLLPRRQSVLWHTLPDITGPLEISPRAANVLAALRRDGALFFDELQRDVRLLPVALENALGELVATGLVNADSVADSFAGMRAMLLPASKRASHDKRHRDAAGPTIDRSGAGRWCGATMCPRPRLVQKEKAPPESRRASCESIRQHWNTSP